MSVDRPAFLRIPPAVANTSIGLLGGSFDPPHAGHVMVSETALRRLGLDAVWWLVSPGNPLKPSQPSASLAARIQAAERLVRDPRIAVAGFEAGTCAYTIDTIRLLKRRFWTTRFVWLMGADNLVGFHRWRAWREIAALVPIAVIDRPGASLVATAAPAARFLSRYRLPEARARQLASTEPPAWVFLHGRRLLVSSTALRRRPRGHALS